MQTKGYKRDTIDKFYTNANVVKSCIEAFIKTISFDNDDLIIEPSAGNGAFIPWIKQLIPNYLFYDLEPGHKDIIKQDYLQLDISGIGIKYRKIHILGNPPFGRQSSLAKKFIKKSCEYCDTISFILPKSFKKDSFQKTFPLCFHIIYQIDLPKHSFQVNGKDYDVPCVFQIWKKRETKRAVKEILLPNLWVLICKKRCESRFINP